MESDYRTPMSELCMLRKQKVAAIVGIAMCLVATEAMAQRARSALSSKAACASLKKRIARHDAIPAERIDRTWFCDVTSTDDPNWWVIGLRSFRRCDGICSNLRGWFAVNRRTGEVREWNVAEFSIGPPIGAP